MANIEQKQLDKAKNINSPEQQKAKNDILKSVNDFFAKDKLKSDLVKQLAPKVLDAMQIERYKIDMQDIRDSKVD